LKVLALGLTSAAQGFPALPYVGSELESLQDLYGATLLLNKDFNLPAVEASMLKETFTIVHIASHGQFDRDVEKTFLLTFDGKLTMNRLDQCVGFFRFREKPLELLTLSACQTAAGDDRAALGLAGVAVKAGARSALASLWFINDQASSLLVEEFYRQLREAKVSRAVALQRAQLKLLADFRYDHPGYWSPFLLINDWL
jgi:CHAT domain-containing protein